MPFDPSIPHADITYRIIGCAMRVQSRLGPVPLLENANLICA
ncbi:MAG: hypothetical protein AB1817_17620 [Chloroflexota bacterium]